MELIDSIVSFIIYTLIKKILRTRYNCVCCCGVCLFCMYQRWSPRGRPWPRGHILKSLALGSKPQVLENCPVLGSKTAIFLNR